MSRSHSLWMAELHWEVRFFEQMTWRWAGPEGWFWRAKGLRGGVVRRAHFPSPEAADVFVLGNNSQPALDASVRALGTPHRPLLGNRPCAEAGTLHSWSLPELLVLGAPSKLFSS